MSLTGLSKLAPWPELPAIDYERVTTTCSGQIRLLTRDEQFDREVDKMRELDERMEAVFAEFHAWCIARDADSRL